ncbi:MAG: TIGR02391 family protein [Limosilactobacillus oris]|uniref:TIGR02391 family protein n=1 Tax=Megasphaera sp. TaxID=2023260 RepID=UPI0025C27F66|nr:TIGR02391 family protein [Megasphaera sp.]MCH3903158.1 TIGR02391 family protein [Limosilactobacillus oris]MCH3931778.1 TIGR02391 family protein [Megasphaera sp.]
MTKNQLQPICKKLADLTTGTKITEMLYELNLPCNLDDRDTKWKRIYNAIAFNQNKTHTNAALIKIIEWIMTPPGYVDRQEEFTEAINDLNVRLSFIGLEILPNGKVQSRSVATTLEEATKTAGRLKSDLEKFKIHPQILAFCRPEIISKNLFHLTFEASKCLLEELRHLSDLNEDGNALVNHCFDGNNPLIIMNQLSNNNEKSEHRGIQSLLNTIVYLYRNPKAHKPKYLSSDTYQSTLEALIMISKARYALERCHRNTTR